MKQFTNLATNSITNNNVQAKPRFAGIKGQFKKV